MILTKKKIENKLSCCCCCVYEIFVVVTNTFLFALKYIYILSIV